MFWFAFKGMRTGLEIISFNLYRILKIIFRHIIGLLYEIGAGVNKLLPQPEIRIKAKRQLKELIPEIENEQKILAQKRRGS